jgi:hypothetical protein
LYNTDIDFQTYNVSNTAVIRKRSLERLNFYNERFTSNQKATLEKFLKTYSNIYNYIANTRDDSSGDYYSACYAQKLWADDLLAKNNYETILKYNLFELKTQNISKAEKKVIDVIIG